MAGEEN